MTDTADLTLAKVRERLGPLLASNAAFDGWSRAALDISADGAGIDRDVAALAFPRGGVDMIEAWFDATDRRMLTQHGPEALAAMKVRERITALIWSRIEAVAGEREALRRALAVLALPQNLPRAARLWWHAADAMWNAAGDRSTDYNWYSKRLTLGGVYASTIAVLLDDDCEGLADTRAFLDRRIDDVMRFEEAKARWTGKDRDGFSMTRFLGRLRYPAV